MQDLDIRLLASLEPISSLGPARFRELLEYSHLETLGQGADPFTGRSLQGQSVYLVSGELEVVYGASNRIRICADSELARHPIGKRQPDIVSATALTRIQLFRVADNLLNQMVMWDQFARHTDVKPSAIDKAFAATEKRIFKSGMFSAENLSTSPVKHFSPANVAGLFTRIEAIVVWNKEAIVREGDEGDYCYLIESGRAEMSHQGDGGNRVLSALKAGDFFGAETLLADTIQNATVTMKSNGVLLRLKKHDFWELMREHRLHKIGDTRDTAIIN